jgi:hypothetical protein
VPSTKSSYSRELRIDLGQAAPFISEQALQRDLFAAEGAWQAAHRAVEYELDRL